MAIPAEFRINTDSRPFSKAVLESLPRQQQILERALGGTRYLARKVRVLAEDAGLTPEQVVEYCEASSHISRSPKLDDEGNIYYGYLYRLRTKYQLAEDGALRELNLDYVRTPGSEVFISFAYQDEHLARELSDSLKQRKVTSYLSAKDLMPGDLFSDKIREALRDCRLVLLLLTTRSITRPWISFEAGAAWALGKPIVPALVQVIADDIILEPLRRHQCYRVESTKERRYLAKKLSEMLQVADQIVVPPTGIAASSPREQPSTSGTPKSNSEAPGD